MGKNDFDVITALGITQSFTTPTLETKTGKRGHPKWYDGKIDLANLDQTRYTEHKVNKGKQYGLRVYVKAFKKFVSLSV